MVDDAEPEVFQDVPYVLLYMTVCCFHTSAFLCVQVSDQRRTGVCNIFMCTGRRACEMAGEGHP